VTVLADGEPIGSADLTIVANADGLPSGGGMAHGPLRPTAAYGRVHQRLGAAREGAADLVRASFEISHDTPDRLATSEPATAPTPGVVFRGYATAADALAELSPADRLRLRASLEFNRVHRDLLLTLQDEAGGVVPAWVIITEEGEFTAHDRRSASGGIARAGPEISAFLGLAAPDFGEFLEALDARSDA
jgi:hypothetical protein